MLFHRSQVERLGAHSGRWPAYPSEHLLFSVRNGAGKLRVVWYERDKGARPYEEERPAALLLDGTPLLQIQSSGCPTCESLLAAGYGVPEDSEELQAVRAAMDRPYAGLDEALERLRPVLGLLPTGLYFLSRSQYHPTDGGGRFFWDVPEELTPCQATAEQYDVERRSVLPCFPCFLYPTQEAEKYDRRRVEHYRQRIQAGEMPALALSYALWGYVSALLDGHHRACACALEGVRVPCLTISRPCRIWREGVPHLIWPDESETPVEELLTPAQQRLFDGPAWKALPGPPPDSGAAVRFHRGWEPEYRQAAGRCPNCYDAGILALYPGVELDAEGIRRLAMDDDYEDASAAARLLRFAARQTGADPKALGMTFVPRGYPPQLRQAAFEILDEIKGDPEVDELMIQVLVECERRDDPIYRIADGHWT